MEMKVREEGLDRRWSRVADVQVAVADCFQQGQDRHARSRTAEQGYSASAGYVWYVVLLLCVVNIFNYVDRMALAVLAPIIKTDLALSDAQLGLLTGFAFAIFYAACGIPIARVADRRSRRNIIALALVVWSAMTALTGAARNFWHLFLARVGVGAGEAGSFSPGASIVCDYVQLNRRSGVLAIHAFGNYAGILTGMIMAGWLGTFVGWRWTFLVLGLPGIVLALVVRFTLREPRRGSLDAARERHIDLSLATTISVLWQCKTYRRLTYFLVVNGFVQYGSNQWWPSFYARVHGLGLSSTGVYLGIAIGAGTGVGVLIGGLVANKTAQRDLGLPLKIGAATTCLAIPTSLGAIFASSEVVSMLLVSATGLLWGISNGPVLAGAYSVVDPRMRATAGAMTTFFTSLLGFGLGPLCVGVLSDILAPSLSAESLRYALLVPVCLIPLMVIALLAAANTLREDLIAADASVGRDAVWP